MPPRKLPPAPGQWTASADMLHCRPVQEVQDEIRFHRLARPIHPQAATCSAAEWAAWDAAFRPWLVKLQALETEERIAMGRSAWRTVSA